MHVLQPQSSGTHVLVLATGDGNLEGQAPNTVAWHRMRPSYRLRTAGWTSTAILLGSLKVTKDAEYQSFWPCSKISLVNHNFFELQAGANFQNLVRTIASGRVSGWTVEVWCWRSSCHSSYKRPWEWDVERCWKLEATFFCCQFNWMRPVLLDVLTSLLFRMARNGQIQLYFLDGLRKEAPWTERFPWGELYKWVACSFKKIMLHQIYIWYHIFGILSL